MVIAHKPQVLDERGEILPTRNMRDGQQNASQVIMAGEVSINICGKTREVVHRQRALGLQGKYAGCLVQI